MTAGNIKKTIFVVLLLAMGIIWLNNAYMYFSQSSAEYVKTAEKENIDLDTHDSFDYFEDFKSNDYNFQDPFQPFFKRIKEDKQRQKEKKQAIIPPNLIYLGLAGGKNNKYAVISDERGNTQIISNGDTCFSVKITKVNPEQISFIYKGKVFSINRK